MIEVLQDLVEELAHELKRSVVVDDAGLRILATSTHYDDADQARINSLVARRLGGAAREYVLSRGAQTWREPTKLPAKPEAGIDRDRVCFPLWSKYELLGFMWLVDDGRISSNELALAAGTAAQLKAVLTTQAQAAVGTDFEVESLAIGLVADGALDRQQAAGDIRDLGLFSSSTSFNVLVVHLQRPQSPWTSSSPDVVRRAITSAMTGRLRESYAYAAQTNSSLLIVGHRTSPRESEVMTLATMLHSEITRVDAAVAERATVGIGTSVGALVDVAESYRQARVAAEIARDLGQVAAAWSNHPLDGLLRAWLMPQFDRSLLPPGLRALEKQSTDLIQVVATYLDSAGNVNATAQLLNFHRTTVYYRLKRFHELTGLDLEDGDTRLLVHLWLRGRRLLGN